MSRQWALLQASIDARDAAPVSRWPPCRSLAAAAAAGPRLAGRRHPPPPRRCRGPTAPASPNPPSDRGHPYRLQPEEIPMSGSDPTAHPTAMAGPPMPYASAVASSGPGHGADPGRCRPRCSPARRRAHRTLLLRPSRVRPLAARVFAVTGGHVNPGPSRQRAPRGRAAPRVRTRIDGSRRIVVLSRKGGAGKTTTTLMLGHTFATHRGDRVVAARRQPRRRQPGHAAASARRSTRQTDLLADRAWVRAVLADPRVHLAGPGEPARGRRLRRRPADQPGTRHRRTTGTSSTPSTGTTTSSSSTPVPASSTTPSRASSRRPTSSSSSCRRRWTAGVSRR